MGEVINICCLLLLLTGHTAVSPIRPPRLQQGSVTLHRSSHAVSHASRTRWASPYRVGTVTPPLGRRKSPSPHVNTLPPLRAIKGGPGLTTKGEGDKFNHTTFVHFVASSLIE